MSGPFIIPQQIFDFSTVPGSGINTPTTLQDSLLVACPINVFTQLMILAEDSKWVQIFLTVGGATTIEIATGAAGVEIPKFDIHMPAIVNFVIAFNSPFMFAAGTRISARPNAGGCNIELHCLH